MGSPVAILPKKSILANRIEFKDSEKAYTKIRRFRKIPPVYDRRDAVLEFILTAFNNAADVLSPVDPTHRFNIQQFWNSSVCGKLEYEFKVDLCRRYPIVEPTEVPDATSVWELHKFICSELKILSRKTDGWKSPKNK